MAAGAGPGTPAIAVIDIIDENLLAKEEEGGGETTRRRRCTSGWLSAAAAPDDTKLMHSIIICVQRTSQFTLAARTRRC